MANRWQLLAGLTIGRDRGVYDRGLNDDFNNPNFNINRQDAIVGQDSTHVGKLVGTYMLPRGFTASTNLRYFTGQPVLKQVTLRGLTQGTVSILAAPPGTFRLDDVTLWDVRLSKIFKLPSGREFEAILDGFNLLTKVRTPWSTRTPGGPSAARFRSCRRESRGSAHV